MNVFDPGLTIPHTSNWESREAINLAAQPLMWLSPISNTLCLEDLVYSALLLSTFVVVSLTKLFTWSHLLFILLMFSSFLFWLIWPFRMVDMQFVFWSHFSSTCILWWFCGSSWVVNLGCQFANMFLWLPCASVRSYLLGCELLSWC